MAARRSRGDGGLSWDEKRQRWVASLTVGYTPSGKRIVKRGRGRTKTEAQRKLREIIRDYEDGQITNSNGYTVAEAVRDWLEFGLPGRTRQHHHQVRDPREHPYHPGAGQPQAPRAVRRRRGPLASR